MGNIKWGIPAEHQRHGWHQWGAEGMTQRPTMPSRLKPNRSGPTALPAPAIYLARPRPATLTGHADLSLTDVKKRLVPP